MTAPLLRVEGLDVVDADGRPRLLGVSLTVAGDGDGGAVVAVLGGAGAGKSALLGAIAGIRPAGAGRVWLRGEAIEGLPPERVLARGVALAAQRRRVFRSLSLAENLLLGAAHRSGAEARAGLARVFELMPELAARRRRPVRELPAAERRLLDIGRALVGRPDLLLLDEPCRDLEPERAAALVEAVRRSGPTAVLLAERALDAALPVADRGVLLVAGRVLAEGTAEALGRDERVRYACLGEAAGLVA